MATVTFTTRSNLVGGNVENISDVTNCLDKLLTGVNAIDKEQLTDTHAQLLGMNNGTNIGRGSSIISTTESRTNAAYSTLTTPDQVASVVLPSGGLMAISYHAIWQETVSTAARAAIFLGSNQLKVQQPTTAAPVAQAAYTGSGNTSKDTPLFTYSGGLVSATTQLTGTTSNVTTGQVLGGGAPGSAGMNIDIGGTTSQIGAGPFGGPVYVFADPGTYTVSVQFKASSGTVTVHDRRLYVWTIGF